MFKTVIVEDDQDTLELIAQIFPKDQFETHLASNGSAGCQLIDDVKPDLVITDVMMAGVDGFGVINHVKQSHLKPVLFLISGSQEITGCKAYDEDAHIFFRKPFDPTELLSAANRFLRHLHGAVKSTILSPREKEIVRLIAKGMTTSEIGIELGISHKTVAKHRENMMRRLSAKNVADLLVKSGLVQV
jgi:DNA-binding NarL/FixJ family response regulator